MSRVNARACCRASFPWRMCHALRQIAIKIDGTAGWAKAGAAAARMVTATRSRSWWPCSRRP
eukprot:6931670-Prymnesium_polylepis.1